MGVMSDLVSNTLGDTSDVDGGEQNSQSFSLAPLGKTSSSILPDGPPDAGNTEDVSQNTSNMINGLMSKALPGPAPINYNDVQDLGPGGSGGGGGGGGGGSGMMGMAMAAMSDVNSKKNISFADHELDHILQQVYNRLKNG